MDDEGEIVPSQRRFRTSDLYRVGGSNTFEMMGAGALKEWEIEVSQPRGTKPVCDVTVRWYEDA